MKKMVSFCDHCGAETTLPPVNVFCGWTSDGVEEVRDIRQLDLCPKCANSLLQLLFNERENYLDPEIGKDLYLQFSEFSRK